MCLEVAIDIDENDIENLAMELEVTESSYMTEFIENLLRCVAIQSLKVGKNAIEMLKANPFGQAILNNLESE